MSPRRLCWRLPRGFLRVSEGEGVDFGEITVYVTKGDVCSVKVNGVGGTQTLLALFSSSLWFYWLVESLSLGFIAGSV